MDGERAIDWASISNSAFWNARDLFRIEPRLGEAQHESRIKYEAKRTADLTAIGLGRAGRRKSGRCSGGRHFDRRQRLRGGHAAHGPATAVAQGGAAARAEREVVRQQRVSARRGWGWPQFADRRVLPGWLFDLSANVFYLDVVISKTGFGETPVLEQSLSAAAF